MKPAMISAFASRALLIKQVVMAEKFRIFNRPMGLPMQLLNALTVFALLLALQSPLLFAQNANTQAEEGRTADNQQQEPNEVEIESDVDQGDSADVTEQEKAAQEKTEQENAEQKAADANGEANDQARSTNRDFIPSEEISEDLPVSFPVDI